MNTVFRAVPVVVSGAMQRPVKIVFERPATVLEAIMEAGGFTPEANTQMSTSRLPLCSAIPAQRKSSWDAIQLFHQWRTFESDFPSFRT